MLFRGVCGNHIIWGAQAVQQARIIHVGRARERWEAAEQLARATREQGALQDEARILLARETRVAETVEDAVSFLRLRAKVTLRDAEAALAELPQRGEDLDPLSYWGAAQGLTYLSQRTPHADARMQLDRAAGRVLELCPLN